MRLGSVDDAEAFGAALASTLRAGDVIALFGDLGAGKTTISRGVLKGLGFSGDVASPTFPIVIAYDPPEVRLPVYHVDLYRIEDEEELQELALDEGRDGGALLVEWPERMGGSLWPDALLLRIAMQADGSRVLTAQVPAAWEGRWPLT